MSVLISYQDKQCTSEAGLAYLTWQLARRGWQVSAHDKTNRRSAKLKIVSLVHPVGLKVQSRAFSASAAVSLGSQITLVEDLDFDVMAVTINAKSDAPACFLLKREEVFALMAKDPKGPGYWLDPPKYRREEFQDRLADLMHW